MVDNKNHFFNFLVNLTAYLFRILLKDFVFFKTDDWSSAACCAGFSVAARAIYVNVTLPKYEAWTPLEPPVTTISLIPSVRCKVLRKNDKLALLTLCLLVSSVPFSLLVSNYLKIPSHFLEDNRLFTFTWLLVPVLPTIGKLKILVLAI
ncbi:Ribonuclease HIII-domain protein [Mycoplasmoides gallisepticum str. F]|nr:Ribonuclease HIII-domain protein [Mycoplasmoides gallisepticum str. F]